MLDTIAQQKIRLRSELKPVRDALSSEYRAEASQQMAARLLPLLQATPFKCLAGYWPMASEADPRPVMMAVQEQGLKVGLPLVDRTDKPLTFRLWNGQEPPWQGPLGNLEPDPKDRRAAPDILLLPMLGFDRRGGRIGFGKGYYDRTLSELRGFKPIIAIGLAFAEQEVPEIPMEKHDQRLDWIVTQKAAIRLDTGF
ncbi:MAG: hypothetical protein Alpg2KO_23920 [Alphaproteobacteria bacterium]